MSTTLTNTTLHGRPPRHCQRRRVHVAATFAALALALAACTSSAEQDSGTDDRAVSSYEEVECPSPNLEGVPSLDFPPEVVCGYQTVPEDRSEPDGKKIRVFVMRLPAESKDPGIPLVMLSGGPGGGGSFQAAMSVEMGLNADRDVILTDQRGTHLADPLLSCPEYDQALNEAVSLPFTSPETTELEVAAVKECRDRLAATGVDLASYNTSENAADVADLRVALGIDEWDVYGVSYGSRLALAVLRDHPEGIRSVVLDSVSPPNVNIAEDWWSAPQSSFSRIIEACAAEPSCAAAYPNLEAEFYTTVNRLAAEPVVVNTTDAAGDPITVNIDAFPFLYAIISASEHGDASGVPKMIHEMAGGDPSATVAATVDLMTPDEIIGVGGHALAFTVFCSESANLTSKEAYLDRSKEVLPEFPESVFAAMPKQGKLFEECPVWDVPAADPSTGEPAVSDLPVLIMEGDFDAATAPPWLDSVTPTLPNAQVVNFPFTGHSVLDKSQCAIDIMNAFLDDPTRQVDGSCAAALQLTFDTQ